MVWRTLVGAKKTLTKEYKLHGLQDYCCGADHIFILILRLFTLFLLKTDLHQRIHV